MALLVHPLLVHFPIALWMTAALFDLLFLWRREQFFATTARYLVGLGLLGALASIVSGWRDLITQEMLGVGTALRKEHMPHQLLAYTATIAYLLVFLGRWRRPSPAGWTIILSLLGAVLIAVTGFVGVELRKVM